MEATKEDVRQFWQAEACGSRNGAGAVEDRRKFFADIDNIRYVQDYMLADFADFPSAAGKKVLEIGLGTGSDFIRWVRAGADTYGRDITDTSVGLVRERLALENRQANVAVGDAENLEFPDNTFDLVYSWGVLHHTPNTRRAFSEACRVLKPGGELKAMIYKYPSISAWLVWLMYGAGRFNWKSARELCAEHVESPGTKYYTPRETREMLSELFKNPPEIQTYLSAGDLLTQTLSSRYGGSGWAAVKRFYPRWLIRSVFGHRFGTIMTIRVTK